MRKRILYKGEDVASRIESFERAIAVCRECHEVIGPGWSEDVGEAITIGAHEHHDTEIVDEWTVEIEVPAEF